MPAVTIERNGPVWTVILDRPEARNAVDGPTAHALCAAFARSTRTTRRRSRCCGVRAARSVPART